MYEKQIKKAGEMAERELRNQQDSQRELRNQQGPQVIPDIKDPYIERIMKKHMTEKKASDMRFAYIISILGFSVGLLIVALIILVSIQFSFDSSLTSISGWGLGIIGLILCLYGCFLVDRNTKEI